MRREGRSRFIQYQHVRLHGEHTRDGDSLLLPRAEVIGRLIVGIQHAHLRQGSTRTGCGPIGLMSIAIAKMAGASRIFATDIQTERRAMAKALGAEIVLDAAGDVVGQIRAATGGVGVDVVLEMSGAETAIRHDRIRFSIGCFDLSAKRLPRAPSLFRCGCN